MSKKATFIGNINDNANWDYTGIFGMGFETPHEYHMPEAEPAVDKETFYTLPQGVMSTDDNYNINIDYSKCVFTIE